MAQLKKLKLECDAVKCKYQINQIEKDRECDKQQQLTLVFEDKDSTRIGVIVTKLDVLISKSPFLASLYENSPTKENHEVLVPKYVRCSFKSIQNRTNRDPPPPSSPCFRPPQRMVLDDRWACICT